MKDIIELIDKGYENEYLDFKSKQYINSESLLTDIMALANSNYKNEKYIILGIKARPNGEKELIGIPKNIFKDSAEYQQFILSNIEPELNIEYFPIKYKEYLLGIIRIKESGNRPYMMKKKYNSLNKGLCYVRKGSHQHIATRADYDRFYLLKGEVGVSIQDCMISARGDKTLARTSVLFRNHSNFPVTIMDGVFEIYSYDGKLLSRHPLYGFDKTYKGADFTLLLEPKIEKYGDIFVGFLSDDCLRLGLDEYGSSEQLYKVKFIVWDSNDREYSDTKEDYIVIAKGKVLWKVKLRAKKMTK